MLLIEILILAPLILGLIAAPIVFVTAFSDPGPKYQSGETVLALFVDRRSHEVWLRASYLGRHKRRHLISILDGDYLRDTGSVHTVTHIQRCPTTLLLPKDDMQEWVDRLN